MAERWQQWMPFHIDRFRGSPDVQAMHPAARMGYLYLLASAWQTDDCSLPADALDLASLSGLGDEMWNIYGSRIMRKFTSEGNRFVNVVLRDEWKVAHDKFESNREARSKAGQIGNAKRWGRKCDENDRKPIANPSQNIATGTGTGTGTDTKKPSRGKREGKEVHPLFAHVKDLISRYYRNRNQVEAPWGAGEAKQLSSLLAEQPDAPREYWNKCILGRSQSEVNHAERPRVWIANLPSYRNAVNAFNRPKVQEAAPADPDKPKYAGHSSVMLARMQEAESEAKNA